jgi:glycosyltransferase involved in cell wall biosynthesis
MDLIFFAPNSVGGVRVYLNNLGSHLALRKVNFKIVYYGFTPISFSNNKFETSLVFSKYDHQKANYKKLKNEICSDSTIIIANDSMELEMYNYFRLRNKLIFVMHGDNLHYESLIKYEIIDQILFVSNALSAKFSKSVGTVIFPIVSNGGMISNDLNETLKIAFVGRLEKAKGADLIKRLDLLLKIEWKFYIPQDYSDFKFIDSVNSKSIFLDSPNDFLLKTIVDCNFIFFPSISEGFGIAVLESMKNGLIPIVRNVNSGIMADLTDGVNCLKFDNLENLVSRINKLLSNPVEYNILKNNAFIFAINEYSSETIIEKFIRTISELKIQKKKYSRNNQSFSQIIPNWIFRGLKKLKYAIN